MKEQFVTYEIALKLKNLGFNEFCMGFFYSEHIDELSDISLGTTTKVVEEMVNRFNCIKAPLWQQVQSFLDDNGVIIGIIFVDNVFKYTLNTNNYVSNGFKDRMSAIKGATEYATNYLWNKKFNK